MIKSRQTPGKYTEVDGHAGMGTFYTIKLNTGGQK